MKARIHSHSHKTTNPQTFWSSHQHARSRNSRGKSGSYEIPLTAETKYGRQNENKRPQNKNKCSQKYSVFDFDLLRIENNNSGEPLTDYDVTVAHCFRSDRSQRCRHFQLTDDGATKQTRNLLRQHFALSKNYRKHSFEKKFSSTTLKSSTMKDLPRHLLLRSQIDENNVAFNFFKFYFIIRKFKFWNLLFTCFCFFFKLKHFILTNK